MCIHIISKVGTQKITLTFQLIVRSAILVRAYVVENAACERSCTDDITRTLRTTIPQTLKAGR